MSALSTLGTVKRALIGRRLPSELAHQERLSKTTGLAVLSSDALSSVAYATEEIVRVLVLGGAAAVAYLTPIGLVIAGLLIVVALSYRQTIHAYPGGGGAYIVARENIGEQAGLIAGASLLIDYVLTVSVSIAAGVAAITSAVPEVLGHRVALGLFFIAVIAVGNLRGIRESGRIFAAPTYFFLAAMLGMLVAGAWRLLIGAAAPVASAAPAGPVSAVSTFLILRAFANGCTAMTGVEAISNGVPAFKPPEERNAAATLVTMATLCVTLFLGTTLLAHAYGVMPSEEETVVSQLARAAFGGRDLPYYAIQAATMLILVLAANTAFADFPRLASIMARDRFLPRQFRNQGDRLAFSNGIVVLALLAAALIVVFGGDTHALIPLYMIGVFVSFSLSQGGMYLKWRREGEGLKPHALLNGVGAALTTVVLIVVAATKFTEGAWVVVAVTPLLVLHFLGIRRHYDKVAAQLSLREGEPEARTRNTVILPISGVHKAVVKALRYARSLSTDVRAVYVETDPAATFRIREEWRTWGHGVPLVVLPSPYRSVLRPLLDYVNEADDARPDTFVTVVLPEFVPARWWHHLMHNQRALLIKGALLFKPNTIVTSVPFHLAR